MSKRRPTISELVEELRLFHHDQAANALQALAPRFINFTTLLDVLPQGSIIRDAEGTVFRHRSGIFEDFDWEPFDVVTNESFMPVEVILPAQILWAPK